jgi:hypothetical protein
VGVDVLDGTLDGLEAGGDVPVAGLAIAADKADEETVGDAFEGGFPAGFAVALLAEGETEAFEQAGPVEGRLGAGRLAGGMVLKGRSARGLRDWARGVWVRYSGEMQRMTRVRGWPGSSTKAVGPARRQEEEVVAADF